MKATCWIIACCTGLAVSHAAAENGYPPPTGPYNMPPAAPNQNSDYLQGMPTRGYPQEYPSVQQGGGYTNQPGYGQPYGYGYPGGNFGPPPKEQDSKGMNPFGMMQGPMNNMINPMRNMFGNSRNEGPDYPNMPPPQWGAPGYAPQQYGAPGHAPQQYGDPSYGYGYPQQPPEAAYGYPQQIEQYNAPGGPEFGSGYSMEPAYTYPNQPMGEPGYGYPPQGASPYYGGTPSPGYPGGYPQFQQQPTVGYGAPMHGGEPSYSQPPITDPASQAPIPEGYYPLPQGMSGTQPLQPQFPGVPPQPEESGYAAGAYAPSPQGMTGTQPLQPQFPGVVPPQPEDTGYAPYPQGMPIPAEIPPPQAPAAMPPQPTGQPGILPNGQPPVFRPMTEDELQSPSIPGAGEG